MSEEGLFAECYVDEGISPVFVDFLRKKGFVVRTAIEQGTVGKSDVEQLKMAIILKSTFITTDKQSFIKDSKAVSREHFGIIVITQQFSRVQAASAAEEVFKNI